MSQERVRVNERVRMRERESEGGKQIEYVINVLDSTLFAPPIDSFTTPSRVVASLEPQVDSTPSIVSADTIR